MTANPTNAFVKILETLPVVPGTTILENGNRSIRVSITPDALFRHWERFGEEDRDAVSAFLEEKGCHIAWDGKFMVETSEFIFTQLLTR